jgi:riboflavin kinase/FMN adenylyltransferase
MECGEFVDRVLIGTMHAEVAVAGFNYRFGKGASGDAAKLQELMKERKKDTRILDEYTVDGETVSTTLIRRRLADGNMREVGTLLGAPYRIRGEVRHGRGVGKSLGFPTVNTTLNGGLAIPKYGVYRSATVIDGRIYSCITNVGICPTFGLSDAHAETYIIGYTGDLYGDSLDIYLLDYLRDEIKFSSPEALIMQINVDKERVINEFGEITWQELGLK